MAELRAARDAAHGADLVEMRLDSVRDPDVAAALAGRRCPVLVTCRPTWEGGQFDGTEEERHRLLHQAFELGAEWVDLEWRGGFERLVTGRHGQNVVLSMHAFDETPSDLETRYRDMRATGAEVVKLATYAGSADDVIRLLELGRGSGSAPIVLVGMGPIGVVSRLLPHRFRSAWTYAGEGVAPGQVPLSQMVGRYRCHRLNETTSIYGVAGSPVNHSLSPVMHNAGFAAHDLDAVYVPFEAVDVGDLMRLARALGVSGLSVTAPFKEAVVDHLDEIDPLGRRVGAVNTLRADGRRWMGLNTDVPGFLAPLERRGGVTGLRSTVLGAGGAARAVAVGLAEAGSIVTVSARRKDRAAVVARLVGGTVGTMPPQPGSWDLLVNTTPSGTSPRIDETPVSASALGRGRTVYDLVYNPARTRLLRDADEAGLSTIGGLDMLVVQAVKQFEWWTGTRPTDTLFRQAALAELAGADGPEAESQPEGRAV